MDFSVTSRPIFTQAITAYRKSEGNNIPFAVAGLNIFLPNTSKKEINKIVEDNFRGGKNRIVKKDGKYYILMKGLTTKVAERVVNRLKAKLGPVSRNLRCLKNTKRIQASAFILGTSMTTKSFEFKYVDLASHLNFISNRTRSMPLDFMEYLKYSDTQKADNNLGTPMVNILA
jgi:hypothetical protein